MRTVGCTVQQALTAEAANVVKQAVTLATRRGHAQVTPLHVANTMLASSSGLLRTACLQSHSHPLQCKALELCFNVALNRLPASTSSPMLGPHCHQPCPQISNALIAAFKRAQAHQRRGSIENQQQPLLAVKIELEQLTISILDDPSVSRVMREAGFSSTQVKSNVEQTVSLEICSQSAPSVSSSKSKESNNVLVLSQSVESQACPKPITCKPMDPIRDEDVMSVVDSLMDKRRRSIVIVGECVGTIEGVVKAVMDKVHKGDVPEVLRELTFETLPVPSFGQYLSRVEVENKLEEVKGLVRIHIGKGVVLNVGNLKWAIDSNSNNGGELLNYMIMEIGKLACAMRESNGGKFWLMGTATFQTFMKCKSCYPSLEIVWGLHPLTVPAGSLRLSLTSDSDVQSQSTSNNKDENGSPNWNIVEGHGEVISEQLTCCSDCSAKFESEARAGQSSACNSPDSTTSNLPAWLQQYKNENKAQIIRSNDQDCVSIKDLCKKWNSFCSSVHHRPQQPYSEKTLTTFSPLSPSSSISIFSNDHHRTAHHDWIMAEPEQHSWRDQQPHFWNFGSDNLNKKDTTIEPSLRMCISSQPVSSNVNHGSTTPNSTSSSELMEMDKHLHKFKELNAENLKTLCNAMEKKVPWRKDVIPDIASTILQCRSGMVRRKVNLRSGNDQAKEETWFFFQGVDIEAKEKIARELAKLVFGTQNDFISISLSSYSSTRADSIEDHCRNKRSRDEKICSYIDKFAEAVSSNPHRVFFIEDVEQADYFSQIGFKRAIETGKVSNLNGEEVGLSDAIIILSCESFSSRSRACSPQVRLKMDEEDQKGSAMEETVTPSVSLDLNISIEDDKVEDEESIDDIALIDSVDRRIMFKIQEL